jgi:hypothetical protein
LSLAQFRDLLFEQTWDHPEAPPVAHEIEYLVDEAASGNLTLPELRDELQAVYEASLSAA